MKNENRDTLGNMPTRQNRDSFTVKSKTKRRPVGIFTVFFHALPAAVRSSATVSVWALLATGPLMLSTGCTGRAENSGGSGDACTLTTAAPTQPAEFNAANTDGAAMRLTWTAGTDDETPQSSIIYEICQTTTSGGCSGGSFSFTYTVAGQTSYTTAALTAGTTYFFTIRAKDANCSVSPVSPQARATAATSPTWQQPG